MQRNRGNGGQGLLGNAPVGFGNQASAFNNNQNYSNMSGFSGGGGSGGNSTAPALSPRGFGNTALQNSHPPPEYPTKRMPGFSRGGIGNFNSMLHVGNNNSNTFNGNNQQHHQQHQPQQQQQRNNSSNVQGMGGLLQLQQQQQRNLQQNQQHQPIAPLSISQGSNHVLNSPQQMNQLFNTDRDSQLALVNSLLKGSLIPNAANNGLNLQQNNNNKIQSPNNSITNMQPGMNMNSQGMGISSLGGMTHPGMNGINHVGMNGGGMQSPSNSLQGSIHGNGLQGGGVSNSIIGNHLNYQQNQFSGGAASAAMVTSINNNSVTGSNNMGMTSPGGGGGSGHSILGVPKAHHQQGILGNVQGLFSNQQSLLGTPSLPRNTDFLQHRGNNPGGFLGRINNNSNNNNRGNNSHHSPHRGGNHGYGGSHMVGSGRGPLNRSITQRGRLERRAPHNHHLHHDSRDNRDSHEGRDSRSRHGGRHDRRNNSIGIVNKRDADIRNEYSAEKRQVALPSGGGDSLRVSVSDGQEEYDPAEPTEDHVEGGPTSESLLLIDNELGSPEVNSIVFHAGQKRPRSHSPVSRSHSTTGDLKVTVDEKGRSVQDGPSQPKRRESPGSDAKDGEDRKFTCYACSVDCKGIQHFETHMRSARHRARMESICSLHVQKTDQQLARMRAEEHLRRIEGREKEDYCRICDKRFVGSFITHRRGQEHRRKERLTKRGCKLCRTGSFVQYCEYVKHIDSEPHKKNKEELRKQEQNTTHSREEEEDDTESFPDSFEELVTLDATGIYKNNDRDEGAKAVQDKDKLPKDKDVGKDLCIQVCDVKEPLLSLPTFDPEVAIGQDHVVPVRGFFCKLCHKFYMSEDAAHSLHCRTRTHFDLYMEYQKALHSKISKLKSVDAKALSPTPAFVPHVAEQEACKDSCQTIIQNSDTLTELAGDQSEQGVHDVDQSVKATHMNGRLDNRSSKSDSLDEDFDECGDVNNDADGIFGVVTDNVAHEDDDMIQGGLDGSPERTPSLHSPTPEDDSIINNNEITNDNDIIMNGGDDDAIILDKDSNGDMDNLDESVDTEVTIAKVAPRKSMRARRGRSQQDKHGWSK